MDYKEDLTKVITQAFNEKVNQIEVSNGVKQRIDKQLLNMKNRERNYMRRFNFRKMMIVGLAIMAFSTTAVFAGGKVTSLVSGRHPFNICRDYRKLENQKKKLGYDVQVIEKFSNGYIFEDMEVAKVKGLDEDGNQVETYKEFCVDYKNELGKEVSLYCNQRNVGGAFRTPVQTLQCDETTLYYYLDTYKFVPVDYKLTEEDKRNLERDDYEISTGSDEVEINMMSSVEWEKDGVRYSLLAIDTEMTADEMLSMSSELV